MCSVPCPHRAEGSNASGDRFFPLVPARRSSRAGPSLFLPHWRPPACKATREGRSAHSEALAGQTTARVSILVHAMALPTLAMETLGRILGAACCLPDTMEEAWDLVTGRHRGWGLVLAARKVSRAMQDVVDRLWCNAQWCVALMARTGLEMAGSPLRVRRGGSCGWQWTRCLWVESSRRLAAAGREGAMAVDAIVACLRNQRAAQRGAGMRLVTAHQLCIQAGYQWLVVAISRDRVVLCPEPRAAAGSQSRPALVLDEASEHWQLRRAHRSWYTLPAPHGVEWEWTGYGLGVPAGRGEAETPPSDTGRSPDGEARLRPVAGHGPAPSAGGLGGPPPATEPLRWALEGGRWCGPRRRRAASLPAAVRGRLCNRTLAHYGFVRRSGAVGRPLLVAFGTPPATQPRGYAFFAGERSAPAGWTTEDDEELAKGRCTGVDDDGAPSVAESPLNKAVLELAVAAAPGQWKNRTLEHYGFVRGGGAVARPACVALGTPPATQPRGYAFVGGGESAPDGWTAEDDEELARGHCTWLDEDGDPYEAESPVDEAALEEQEELWQLHRRRLKRLREAEAEGLPEHAAASQGDGPAAAVPGPLSRDAPWPAKDWGGAAVSGTGPRGEGQGGRAQAEATAAGALELSPTLHWTPPEFSRWLVLQDGPRGWAVQYGASHRPADLCALLWQQMAVRLETGRFTRAGRALQLEAPLWSLGLAPYEAVRLLGRRCGGSGCGASPAGPKTS